MPSTLGQRLKLLINESGLEQQKVAALLCIKTPTFNGYVGDKREPTIDKLKQFAEYFKVSVDYLVGYSEQKCHDLNHLSDIQNSFIHDPGNKVYIELAMEIKAKTIAS